MLNEIAVQTPGRSRILVRNNGDQVFYTIAGTQRIANLSSTIPDNVWTNLTITKDSLVGSKLYIDSAFEYSNPNDTGVISGAYATGWSGTVIGTGAESVYFLNGKIGSIHVYNRALSATEITHNYNAMVGRFS